VQVAVLLPERVLDGGVEVSECRRGAHERPPPDSRLEILEGQVELEVARHAPILPARRGEQTGSLEGYRRMSPAKKLDRVRDLNWTLQQLAIARPLSYTSLRRSPSERDGPSPTDVS